MLNIPAYLERIQFRESPRVDLETLGKLQLAHMLNVPFENLDIGLGRPILLTEQALWDKIIVHKRGGFCYELNGMFAWLLREIGFDVTYLNARDLHEDGTPGPDFDHLALLVKLDSKRWLADVGWGDSFTHPLNMDLLDEQPQGLRAYRLDHEADRIILWQKNYTGEWKRQYFFDLISHQFPDEYESTCLYHQTSPDSIFTQKSIISRLTPEGRISLENSRLIVTTHSIRKEYEVNSNEEYQKLLLEHFETRL